MGKSTTNKNGEEDSISIDADINKSHEVEHYSRSKNRQNVIHRIRHTSSECTWMIENQGAQSCEFLISS